MLRMSGFKVGLALLLLCFSFLIIVAECQVTDPVEVKALRGIRESLIDTKKYLRSWGLGDPCTSNWTGVLCFNTTLNDGYLHVRELQLLNMNLSGTLSPELGRLSYMEILDVLWNNISGSLPKEIGNITSLELLLVSGNQLTGSLPEEIGYLPNLERIQIDENQISGPIPKSFANLNKTRHFHMNNNSLSGHIPPELHILPNLFHLLLDNNNLSGHLPPELSESPKLLILQLDNNNFEGSMIPPSYGNMSHLLKMSLRNCSLQGPMPDLSGMHALGYIDLSSNQINGSIPAVTLSQNITTIDLSNNQLTGAIPSSFSGLPHLQKLSLLNNTLNGSVPSTIWQNRTFNIRETLILDFQNNNLTNISGSLNLPPNVTLSLQGNPICSNGDAAQLCGTPSAYGNDLQSSQDLNVTCPAQACPPPYQYAPASLEPCFCAAPLLVGYRLKSPGFSGFDPYIYRFEDYLTSGLKIDLHQLDFTYQWQKGPRLRMNLKIFPLYVDNSSYIFNKSEVFRIRSMFTGWLIPYNYFFGPYELLNFTLLDPYKEDFPTPSSSGLSKGAVAGIVIGSIAGAITVSVLISLIILRSLPGKYHPVSRRRRASRVIKIDGVKSFSFEEMKRATNNFDRASEVGQGGYGKVYKGILADGAAVAIKRAQEGSLQGEKEFLTEIELLSRLHHRNLVSLLGFCEEEGEQMLVYEFMSNGTLRDLLSGAKYKEPLSFAMRVKIALASAKGILYLHTEADPPIFHRDIKATNILLDSSFIAKVADFGLSRLAPVPDIEGIVPGHVSTVVKGTPGYLDPEYFLTHKLTDKSDVYSLGVVLLEILTGMYPITHGKNIVREVNMSYSSGMICSLIDEKMGSYPSDSVEKFVTLALKCCREETDERPSMAEVVRELENIWHMLPESDSRTTDSSDSNVGKAKDMSTQSSSSSSNIKNSYVSTDISSSDLVSGVVPTISPR